LKAETESHEEQREHAIQQLNSVFLELQEGLIVLDHSAVIQFANPACENTLGKRLTPGEVLAEGDLPSAILSTMRGARARSEWALGPVYESETGRLIQPQAGNLEGGHLVIVLRDVTLERRMETMRREFVANVSHELKTPLTAIRGYAEMLSGELEDPVQDRFVGRILVQCQRLQSLLEDVMELSRMESKEVISRKEKVKLSLAGALTEASEIVSEASSAQQTEISLSTTGVVDFVGYREFLEQMFLNLIDNAVKYSPDGSTVGINLVESADEVRVVVEDNGPGIANEHLPHLFERFYRVDSGRARSSGGTGLGLAIVKHAARVHGGVVTVESELNQGTKFEVRLPKVALSKD